MSNVIKNNQYINADSFRILAQTQAHALAAEVVSSQQVALTEELEQQRMRLFQLEEEWNEKLEQLEQERKQLMEEAEYLKAEAQQEIEQWWEQRRKEDQQEAVKVREEASIKGHDEGYKKGVNEAKKKMAATITEAVQALEHSMQVKQQLIAEAEPFLVELSLMIARKIIHKQLTVQPQLIVEMVKEHLKKKTAAASVTILVSPAQFPVVYAARESLIGSLDAMAELLVIPDPHVSEHGCIIRTPSGNMDCTLDTQFEAIRETLVQVAREGQADGTD